MHKGRETPKGNLEKIGNESKNETESKKKVSARKHIHSGHTIRKLEKPQNRECARDGVPPSRKVSDETCPIAIWFDIDRITCTPVAISRSPQ